jgi:acid phosphatase (class A)
MKQVAEKFLGILAVAMCFAALPAYAEGRTAADFNAIRFTDDMWDPTITAKLPTLQPKYVSADHKFTLEPAPANDSETTKEDLATLHKYEKENRTPDQVALIKEEVDLWKDLKLDPSVPVSEDVRKKVTALTAESSLEELYFSFVIKREYKRARATQLDKTLTTVIPVPGHPSYPSAHGGQTHTVALVLGYIDPAHADQYMQNANDIGRRREIAGVHYPSDTKAGIELGTQVFNEMMKNHDFKTKIDELAEAVRTAKPD